MSEPEIARRCVACGATVRQRAMFCPQCGNPIPQGESAVTTVTTPSDTVVDQAPPPVAVPPPARHPDGVKARVEKLRHVSSVVLDQAAYDPSLRFLLVAAAFFILFLVLLILSKVIG
jgi:zinc ribbon protein